MPERKFKMGDEVYKISDLRSFIHDLCSPQKKTVTALHENSNGYSVGCDNYTALHSEEKFILASEAKAWLLNFLAERMIKVTERDL